MYLEHRPRRSPAKQASAAANCLEIVLCLHVVYVSCVSSTAMVNTVTALLSIAPESQSLLELGEDVMIVTVVPKRAAAMQLENLLHYPYYPSLQARCWGTLLCRAPRLRPPPVRALPCTDELASSSEKYGDTDVLVAFIHHPPVGLVSRLHSSRVQARSVACFRPSQSVHSGSA